MKQSEIKELSVEELQEKLATLKRIIQILKWLMPFLLWKIQFN